MTAATPSRLSTSNGKQRHIPSRCPAPSVAAATPCQSPCSLLWRKGHTGRFGTKLRNNYYNIKAMNENKQLPSVVGPWVIMALCLLYGVSPVDIIPDIPIVGQIDDLIIMLSGSLNLAQRYMERADSSFTIIVKVTKWIVIALGAIVILLLALFAVAIVNLFK